MQLVLYSMAFFVAILFLAILVKHYGNTISIYYFLLFSGVVITNFGFMGVAFSRSLEAAILAKKVAYIGACFTPMFMTRCVADLCQTKLNRFIRGSITALSGICFLSTALIGYSDLYYKDPKFEIINGVGVISKSAGPLYVLFPLILFVMLVNCSVIVIKARIGNKAVSRKTCNGLLFIMVSIALLYAIEKLLGWKVELLPFIHVIFLSGVLLLLGRISMYDVKYVSMDSLEANQAFGIAIFDSGFTYYGANDAAREWFPDLKELNVDEKITEENTELLRTVKSWINNETESENELFEINGRTISIEHYVLKKTEKISLHCIYMRDDTEQQNYTRLVENYTEDLEEAINEKTKTIQKLLNDIIGSMAIMVDSRDHNTGDHVYRTSEVVRVFVNHLLLKGSFPELTEDISSDIIQAAPLHDFGKIAIPDAILNKPGKFTKDDYEIMKQHSAKGAEMIESIMKNSEDELFKRIAKNVAMYHHEKWDGTGYPTGKSTNEIPFEARVMALADVFDALVSKRVYKEKMSYADAFGIIMESSGSHFDPDLCVEFLECRDELERLYDSYRDE